ncbi:prepilin peptidase [Mesorhizobium sp. BR1-1-16]|uniref:A24 family peptidase n=1 Tax=Mesorhizobium sp. BR1-1-16 TaxID=2876653 RepID=UPI001CCDBAFB|nr:prepilin peptidase [Mesorhizobium sp. BR1-1-16]MBZ9938513.1 prepilin peptidase [Mesorhizobium sp. BR1-1-16]
MSAFLETCLYFAFPVAVVAAAFSDLVTMTIPNRLSAALALIFPFAALAVGMPLAVFGMHIVAGLLVLGVGIIMFSRGWIGGGDAKLAAAIALWLGFDQLLVFFVYASLFGGMLTLGILAFRSRMVPAFALRQEWLMRLHDRDAGVPYGIAIAAGAMMIYAETPFMALSGSLI